MARRRTVPAVYLCGGEYDRLDPREPCRNALHDWPLPLGYVDAGIGGCRAVGRWVGKQAVSGLPSVRLGAGASAAGLYESGAGDCLT